MADLWGHQSTHEYMGDRCKIDSLQNSKVAIPHDVERSRGESAENTKGTARRTGFVACRESGDGRGMGRVDIGKAGDQRRTGPIDPGGMGKVQDLRHHTSGRVDA